MQSKIQVTPTKVELELKLGCNNSICINSTSYSLSIKQLSTARSSTYLCILHENSSKVCNCQINIEQQHSNTFNAEI